MSFWASKVALVTDCADDVGVTIVEKIAKTGMTVISFGKTEDAIEKVINILKPSTGNKIDGKIILYQCDITDANQLNEAFRKIKDTYTGVDVLVNNAYCGLDALVANGDLDTFQEIIDVNIFALVACTRLAAGSMIERGTRGHIININDFRAYQIPEDSSKSVFIASKAAVTSVNEILRQEFRFMKVNIKVTNIACGSIESTDNLDSHKLTSKAKDVAKLVKLILNTPEHLQVHEVLMDSVDE